MVFRPEVAKGFELGYKATLAGGRLRFDLNAYSYLYADLQVVRRTTLAQSRSSMAGAPERDTMRFLIRYTVSRTAEPIG